MTGEAKAAAPLEGWRVLVPRSGAWGERARAGLEARGARAVVSDLLVVTPPPDAREFQAALGRLADGGYDWLMVTSAAAADALRRHGAAIASATRVAAVGEATADALREAGIAVAFTPGVEASGSGLADGWQEAHGGDGPARILIPRSSLAPATLPARLAAWGHRVDAVTAYVVTTVAPRPTVVAAARSGALDAVLVTSGSVAQAIAEHLAPLGAGVSVVSIGPVTTAAAEARGLRVARTAERRSVAALLDALEDVAATSAPRVSARGAR